MQGLLNRLFEFIGIIDNRTDPLLKRMIEKAKELGLNDSSIKFAEDDLEDGEAHLCFELLVTQMYEYDIAIDHEFFNLTCKVGKLLDIPEEDYIFIRALLK